MSIPVKRNTIPYVLLNSNSTPLVLTFNRYYRKRKAYQCLSTGHFLTMVQTDGIRAICLYTRYCSGSPADSNTIIYNFKFAFMPTKCVDKNTFNTQMCTLPRRPWGRSRIPTTWDRSTF